MIVVRLVSKEMLVGSEVSGGGGTGHLRLTTVDSKVLTVGLGSPLHLPPSAIPKPRRSFGAPHMTPQPVSAIFLCSPLPSRTWRIPGLSIPWCCLPTSFSLYFVFFPLSLCFARWPDLMNGRHVHTTQFAYLYDGQEVFVWSDCQ